MAAVVSVLPLYAQGMVVADTYERQQSMSAPRNKSQDGEIGLTTTSSVVPGKAVSVVSQMNRHYMTIFVLFAAILLVNLMTLMVPAIIRDTSGTCEFQGWQSYIQDGIIWILVFALSVVLHRLWKVREIFGLRLQYGLTLFSFIISATCFQISQIPEFQASFSPFSYFLSYYLCSMILLLYLPIISSFRHQYRKRRQKTSGAQSLDAIMNDGELLGQFTAYCVQSFVSENLQFLLDVAAYEQECMRASQLTDVDARQAIAQIVQRAAKLRQKYINITAPSELNISRETRRGCIARIRKLKSDTSSLQDGLSVFTDVRSEVQKLLSTDVLPRFQAHTLRKLQHPT